jgi:hypothetical protein
MTKNTKSLQQPDLPIGLYDAIIRTAASSGKTMASIYRSAIEQALMQYIDHPVEIPIMRERKYQRLTTMINIDENDKNTIDKICREQNIYLADFIRWAIALYYEDDK